MRWHQMNTKIWDKFLAVPLMIFFLSFVPPLGAQVVDPGGPGVVPPYLGGQDVGPGQGNIKIGSLEVHPYLGLTGTYDDNVYRNYGNLKSESDFITTLTPWIQLFLPFQRNSLQLDYNANINWFANNSGTNYTSQKVGGVAKFDFPVGLLFKLSDYFSDDTIPRKAKNGDNSANDPYRALPFYLNNFDVMARYRFVDRWAIEARYNNYDYRYQNSYDDSGSYNRGTFGGSIYYRFASKTDVLLDYNYGITSYYNSTSSILYDNKVQTIYAGLSFDPTAKLRGYLKLGWAITDFDHNLAGRSNSFSTTSSLVDLTYNLARHDELNLKANRTILIDVDTNAPYINTDISLGYKHVLAWNEKVSLNVYVGYGTLEFEGSTTDIDGTVKTRNDTRYYGGVGVSYALQRWLKLGLNYIYTDNDSNFLNYNYIENKIWFTVAAAF